MFTLTVFSSHTETITTHSYTSQDLLEQSLTADFGLDKFQVIQLILSRGRVSTEIRDFELVGPGIPAIPHLGDRLISYEIQPHDLDDKVINHGMSYSNANTLEDARATALRRVNTPGTGYVHIHGLEMELGPSGWHPVLGGRSHDETITRTEPVQLSAADMQKRCYESATGGISPTHDRRSDGSCHCGVFGSRFPAGNTPHRPKHA